MLFKQLPLLLLTTFAVMLSVNLHAQKKQDKKTRKSPAVKEQAMMGDIEITINYGSPAVNGRRIWGSLVPFGKVWRTGANEATTFELNQAVMIDGKEVPAGKYSLFTIPRKEEWTFILNSDAKQWGAYNYDEEKEVLRFSARPGQNTSATERLTFDITTKGGAAAYVNLKWENLVVGFEIRPITK